MKKSLKILKVVGILFFAGELHALTGQGNGSMPTYPVKTWITAVSTGVDTNVLFTSGPVTIHAVICGSCTINAGGANFIQFYGSTSPTFGSWVTTLTPKISLDGNPSRPVKDTWLDIFNSTYTFYDKKGISEIGILYDWFNDTTKTPKRYFNGYPSATGNAGGQ